ncbi:DnaB-like helicase N-terminal domain-containing protein [Kitasatospora sp. NPDC088783]|uniref:DnaB-like helicase N-terminal domain-containing protein n=1 Tax=Kitasatospora sp. NPDC088783 TaxID=3364077 RepID=UPI00380E472D
MTPQMEAEQAVLGALLLAPRQLANVATWLEPRNFYRPAHAALYEALLAQQQAGHPALAGEKSEARRAWALEAMESAAASCPSFTPFYGHTLISACPTSDHAALYGRMVLESAVRREVHEHAHRLLAAARAADVDPDVVIRLTADLRAAIDRLADTWGSIDARPLAAAGPWPLELPEAAARQTRHQEEALLASLTAAPAELADLVGWLHPGDLLDAGHREVYRALAALAHRGEPIDPLTVLWEVQHRGALTDGTLTAERVRTLTRAGYQGEPGYRAEQVLRASLLRTTASHAGAVRLLAMDASVPAARLLGSALHTLRGAEAVQSRWRAVTGRDAGTPCARGDPAVVRRGAARTRTLTPPPAPGPAAEPSPAQRAAPARAPVRSTY